MIKGTCGLVHGSTSAWVTAAKFRPCWSCTGGDTGFFILPGDVAWLLGLRGIWLSGWETLAVYHYATGLQHSILFKCRLSVSNLLCDFVWPRNQGSYYLWVGAPHPKQGLIQANFNVGIPILGSSVFSAEIKKKQSTYKGKSQTKFKFIILNQSYGKPPQNAGFCGYTSSSSQFQRRKIGLCCQHHPRYFSRLVRGKSLLAKSSGYPSCGSGDVFLFCRVASRGYTFQGTCDLAIEAPSPRYRML